MREPVILVIDDDPVSLAIVTDYLNDRNIGTLVSRDGESGLKRAEYARPDLILLDIMMPGMDGYETCCRLKAMEAVKDVPVIFMTALTETENKVKGFEAGAVDYITKPFQQEEVLARVGVHLRIRELTHSLQEANETLEKRVEERTAELKDSERRLADIINFLPDATFAINLQGEVTLWNSTAEKMTGVSGADIVGKGKQEYSIPFYGARRPMLVDFVLEPSPEMEKLYHYVKRENGVVTGECLTSGSKLGGSYLLGQAAPLNDSEGKMVGVIETVRDITDRKKLEEQLRHSQKMEAVGTLAGGVAHDFNNILTAIIGYGTLLKMKLGDEESRFVDEILSASDRAANLVNNLLAFSRKQVMSPRPQKVDEIVKGIDKLLLRVIGEDIEFKTVLGCANLVVMADCGQIEQVLMNLAANSRDAMPDGGILTISTERVYIPDDKSRSYIPPGAYAVISVSDTGTGIDEKTQQRIFEPFFTTKETGKGTGLGLSMVYGIIKQHNGEIIVYSEPGKGTIFRIYLKLVDSKVESIKAAKPVVPIGGTETILIAEDNADVRKFMITTLGQFGYRVVESADGEEVVAKFMEHRDEIQLVILDVIMPKQNGKIAYEEIRKVRGDVPVLFTSGYTADLINSKGILETEYNFVSKPIAPHLFLSKIREVLDAVKIPRPGVEGA